MGRQRRALLQRVPAALRAEDLLLEPVDACQCQLGDLGGLALLLLSVFFSLL